MVGAVVDSFFHYMKTWPIEAKEDHPDADLDDKPDEVVVIEEPPGAASTARATEARGETR